MAKAWSVVARAYRTRRFLEMGLAQVVERPVLVVLAVFLLLAAPLLVLGEISAADTRARTRSSQLQAASDAAVGGAELVGAQLTQLRQQLQFYGGVPELQAAVEERDVELLASRHRAISDVLAGEVADLAIVDADGGLLAGTATFDVARYEPFQRAKAAARERRSTRPIIGLIGVSATPGTADCCSRLAIAAPVRRNASTFVGALVAELRAADVANLLRPQAAASEDLLLVDRNGLVAAHASDPRDVVIDLSANPLIRSVIAGVHETIEADDPLGRGLRFVSSAPVGDTDWYVVATHSSDATEKDLTTTLNQLLVLRLVLVTMLVGGAYALARAAADLARQRRSLATINGRLEEATAAKSRFLASMSHDLRTPLNSIIGFSDVLLGDLAGPLNPRQREYVSDIVTSGRHQLQLINDILDLSKVEAGRMEFHPEQVELSDLLDGVHSIVRPLAIGKGQDLRVETTDIVTLFHDPIRLRQVVFNLLGNAVKFTPEGGSVTTKAWLSDQDHIRISIADTGVGIAESDLHRLFEEFERVGNDYARAQQGSGLGLALVRRFVEEMGGRIEVISVLGRGSTFTVQLPLSHPGHPAVPSAARR